MAVALGVGVMVAAIVGAAWTYGTATGRADGNAVLILVEDVASSDDPTGLGVTAPQVARAEERRADSILLVRWFRRCDAVSITSIPRDLVIEPRGESVAVLHHTIGAAALADRIERSFDVSIVAVSVLDVADVARLAAPLGPVPVELDADSRDRRTGFQATAGTVDLAGDELVAYLRSRGWEEWRDDAWVVVDTTDLDRIERLHGFLEAAATAYGEAPVVDRLRLGVAGVRDGNVAARDPLGALGFAAGASSFDHLSLHVPAVVEERQLDDRRSPFDPDDLGSGYRLRLAEPNAALPDPCTADGSDQIDDVEVDDG